jgi:hypothetical protein
MTVTQPRNAPTARNHDYTVAARMRRYRLNKKKRTQGDQKRSDNSGLHCRVDSATPHQRDPVSSAPDQQSQPWFSPIASSTSAARFSAPTGAALPRADVEALARRVIDGGRDAAAFTLAQVTLAPLREQPHREWVEL